MRTCVHTQRHNGGADLNQATARSTRAFIVRAPGLQTTVQDRGRLGYSRYGVPSSGAVDGLSLRLGNLLLDNPPDAAGLEMTLSGPTLEAVAGVSCAYVGADMRLRLNDRSIDPGQVFSVTAGDVLRFGAPSAGARAYLCVGGGVHVPVTLGSRSTTVTASLGGMEGRPLRAGDVLHAGTPPAPGDALLGRRLRSRWLRSYGHEWELRITEGPHAETVPGALGALVAGEWKVSHRSDRMGVRLEGPTPIQTGNSGIETEGTPPGAVQVPPDGAPILLLADRGVTGGYPMPAAIATVDLPLAGQLRPGDTVWLRLITVSESISLLREQERSLAEPVFEQASPMPDANLAEFVKLLHISRVEELRLEVGKSLFRWKRGRPPRVE